MLENGKNTMAKYRVNYYFDGRASAIVEANSPEEARQKWEEGETEDDQDNSENYCFDSAELA